MSESTHVYLVSAQATPNITPATDPRVAPRRVVLVVSPDMRQRAVWLGEVLRGRGVKVEEWPIEDPWDIVHLSGRVLEFLENEVDLVRARDLALNATGGTKPMSIAAYEAFRAYELPIFYVHPEKDRVVWLHPTGRDAIDLEDRLQLEPFLGAHGAEVIGSIARDKAADRVLELAVQILRDIERLQDPLRALNWLAQGATGSLKSKLMSPEQKADPHLGTLIETFADGGYLRRDGDRLIFADEPSRFFVNGGWFELYVFDRVWRLRSKRPHVQDIGRHIEVRRIVRKDPVKNEIDVALLAENRLHVIECKTRHWGAAHEDGAGAQSLYKLDSLKDLVGGLQARGMLVSYQELPDYDRRRAADLRIEVCAGRDLQRLDEKLKHWIP